jgi:hypothetical protein
MWVTDPCKEERTAWLSTNCIFRRASSLQGEACTALCMDFPAIVFNLWESLVWEKRAGFLYFPISFKSQETLVLALHSHTCWGRLSFPGACFTNPFPTTCLRGTWQWLSSPWCFDISVGSLPGKASSLRMASFPLRVHIDQEGATGKNNILAAGKSYHQDPINIWTDGCFFDGSQKLLAYV